MSRYEALGFKSWDAVNTSGGAERHGKLGLAEDGHAQKKCELFGFRVGESTTGLKFVPVIVIVKLTSSFRSGLVISTKSYATGEGPPLALGRNVLLHGEAHRSHQGGEARGGQVAGFAPLDDGSEPFARASQTHGCCSNRRVESAQVRPGLSVTVTTELDTEQSLAVASIESSEKGAPECQETLGIRHTAERPPLTVDFCSVCDG